MTVYVTAANPVIQIRAIPLLQPWVKFLSITVNLTLCLMIHLPK